MTETDQLSITAFVEQGEIQTLVEDFLAFRRVNPEITFSDIVDDDGNEYVDLVMEGGGVLGFALVGYTYFLEAAGFRFLRIGGTSAGAINALALAALDRENGKTRSEIALERLSTIDIGLFVDGDEDVQELINLAIKDESRYGLLQKFFPTGIWLWNLYSVKDSLDSNLGLNPGVKFHEWLKNEILRETDTSVKLRQKMHALPPLTNRRDNSEFTVDKSEELLKIVAADVTTESKVVFPEMAKLYWENPDEAHPADFVRASMSLPIFFQPFRRSVPQDKLEVPQNEVRKKWIECVSYKGTTPKDCYFVDGGVISNFPINLFHREANLPPRMPTFGARLSVDREMKKINTPLSLLDAVFAAARHTLDFDFILRHPDYEQVVTKIDTGNHNWLNFDLTNNEKYDLFKIGARAAAAFLRGFNWEEYRKVRKTLADASRRAGEMKKQADAAHQHVQSLSGK
jgi:NTE family protein